MARKSACIKTELGILSLHDLLFLALKILPIGAFHYPHKLFTLCLFFFGPFLIMMFLKLKGINNFHLLAITVSCASEERKLGVHSIIICIAITEINITVELRWLEH